MQLNVKEVNGKSWASVPECMVPVPLKTSNTQRLTSWQPGLMSRVQMLLFSTSPTISAHTGWMIIFYPSLSLFLSLNPISWKKVLCGTTPHQLFIPVFTPNPCGFLCILNRGKGAALPDVLILVIFIWCLSREAHASSPHANINIYQAESAGSIMLTGNAERASQPYYSVWQESVIWMKREQGLLMHSEVQFISSPV